MATNGEPPDTPVTTTGGRAKNVGRGSRSTSLGALLFGRIFATQGGPH